MIDFIESGLLEAYVTGSASAEEEKEVLYMTANYPEVKLALTELEADMELLAQHMAVLPPPGTWDKIEGRINDLILRPEEQPDPFSFNNKQNGFRDFDAREQFIEVEAASDYMKISKTWKWVFAAVFVLGKIFLGCAIYFYLENRQAQQQIQELKTEIKTVKGR